MNVLILGSGGREHAMAWKISQSERLNQLYTMPGNPGTALCGTNLSGDIMNFDEVNVAVEQYDIDMIIVGPEAPLVEGIYDYFKDHRVKVIGPSQEAAKLEGSKAYAKEFMLENDIPTAAYGEFTAENLDAGLAHLECSQAPYVLKADGLAGGKGVLILTDLEEAKAELKAMLSGKFGGASSTVVIEEFLDGIEFSVFVVTDGKSYHILPVAKDYKRIGEGDTGLNTGGMGAVSPVSFVDDELMEKVEEQIIKPTMTGIQKRGVDYQGFIFFGLINVDGQPKVIEYNCRMGDPETEVVLPRIDNDLLEVLSSVGEDDFTVKSIDIKESYATTVMLVSGGYPEAYEKGKEMTGVDDVVDSIVFHAGTKMDGEALLTNGGRVMALTSYGESKEVAISKSMTSAEKVNFDGKYYRKDIGFDLD